MKAGGLLLNRTRQAPVEDSAAFAGVAERFRRAGDLDRAIALCREGLTKFPKLLSARVTLGWALLDKGLYDEARKELEQVLRRAPDNLAAIRGLAELHDRTEHMSTLDATSGAAMHPEEMQPAPPAEVPAPLDAPISLAHLDFSTPLDAPVEIETAAKATLEPSAFAQVTPDGPTEPAPAPGPYGDLKSSAVNTVAVAQHPQQPVIQFEAATEPDSSETEASPSSSMVAAAQFVAEPAIDPSSGAASVDLEALNLEDAVKSVEGEAFLTLPDADEISFEALASEFEADPSLDDASAPVLELASAADGTDPLIAELAASEFDAASTVDASIVESQAEAVTDVKAASELGALDEREVPFEPAATVEPEVRFEPDTPSEPEVAFKPEQRLEPEAPVEPEAVVEPIRETSTISDDLPSTGQLVADAPPVLADEVAVGFEEGSESPAMPAAPDSMEQSVASEAPDETALLEPVSADGPLPETPAGTPLLELAPFDATAFGLSRAEEPSLGSPLSPAMSPLSAPIGADSASSVAPILSLHAPAWPEAEAQRAARTAEQAAIVSALDRFYRQARTRRLEVHARSVA